MVARILLAAFMTVVAAAPGLAQGAPKSSPVITAVVPTPDDRARQWLVLVDDKNYAQSWAEASPAFKAKRTKEAWAKMAAAMRAPLGAVASRDLKSIDLSRSNTAIVRYDTNFARRAGAVETVTLTFENGGWSVSDYSIASTTS